MRMMRILIVDDDRHMRSVCSRALSREGWIVFSAESGDEGIKKIRSGGERIDVVLLDQLMPGMSGMEVLAQIRSINPDMRVIIITGSATEESAAELIRNGASDCLPKPFTPEELRTAVKKAAASLPAKPE
jgi:DNA-binding NtrC family response regulator